MASALANIPAEGDLLCEDCGYSLNGLPPGGNCPECGKPVAGSARDRRSLTAWEKQGGIGGFLSTTLAVMFHPARFYRTLVTRRPRTSSFWFAQIHWIIACLLMGWAMRDHADHFFDGGKFSWVNSLITSPILGTVVIALVAMATLEATTLLAARLTYWEATYRGLRLPLNAVLRGLDFHAAHYLPIAVVAFITMSGYHWLTDHRVLIAVNTDTKYIYALCAEVVGGAAYLFNTYWIGMRNMMYANA